MVPGSALPGPLSPASPMTVKSVRPAGSAAVIPSRTSLARMTVLVPPKPPSMRVIALNSASVIPLRSKMLLPLPPWRLLSEAGSDRKPESYV